MFAEIGQQGLPPAGRDFAQSQHGVESMLLGPFVMFIAFRIGHHLAQFDDVLQSIDHPCCCRLAIAAGPAGFLIVGLEGPWQIKMSDKPNVRFVDSHAEGDGGHDNDSFIPEKQRLMGRTQLCTQASVIGIGVEALLT